MKVAQHTPEIAETTTLLIPFRIKSLIEDAAVGLITSALTRQKKGLLQSLVYL